MATLSVWEWDRERERERDRSRGCLWGGGEKHSLSEENPLEAIQSFFALSQTLRVFFLFFHTTKHTHRHNVSQTETQSVQENIYWMYSIC